MVDPLPNFVLADAVLPTEGATSRRPDIFVFRRRGIKHISRALVDQLPNHTVSQPGRNADSSRVRFNQLCSDSVSGVLI